MKELPNFYLHIEASSENKRDIIINAIMECVRDEFDSHQDYMELAKKSEKELRYDLVNIVNYLCDSSN